MKTEKSRSQQEIFSQMHRELRTWNSDVPESVDRLDPVLRILLQLYSSQLAKIESRNREVWDIATRSLFRSFFPDALRFPVPAYTVMKCDLTDPIVEVDTNTRFIYKEEREGGQTFFFAPIGPGKLLDVELKHILVKSGDAIRDILGDADGSAPLEDASREPLPPFLRDPKVVYIGLDYDGDPSDFTDACLFFIGDAEAVRLFRWSQWRPGSATGRFSMDNQFCPGLKPTLELLFAEKGTTTIDWSGLRTGFDLFGSLEDYFVLFPAEFVSSWERGHLAGDVVSAAMDDGVELASDEGILYWIQMELPEGGEKEKLASYLRAYANCIIVTNRNEHSIFKHTGGNRLVEIEIPEDIAHVLQISSVVDSDGNTYRPAHRPDPEHPNQVYSVEERNNKLVLWVDFISVVETPPDSLTVAYTTTAGIDANGIGTGKINELYENHPGLTKCVNLIPTNGAIPAKTDEQLVNEAKVRLRSRDRALGFREVATWVKSFDPRVMDATCENTVRRSKRGVHRCVHVTVKVDGSRFYSKDEMSLLKDRLMSFLKSRSPVNTQFDVDIVPS